MDWKLRGNTVVYGLIAILAVISLLILFRLRERFQNNLSDRVSDLQHVFASRSLLKVPSDHKIVFSQIEAEAEKYENRGDFGSIWIAKSFGGVDHFIYPFYYSALERAGLESPRAKVIATEKRGGFFDDLMSPERLIQKPLIADGERLGTLFVQVNTGAFRTVSLVIWTLGAMLATTLAFLATQFRRQEKVISATTIELEEKRRELVRLERLAMAGQLSANILHDLKKPVLNIRNETDEAFDSGEDAEISLGILGRIREQADFFLTMLKDAGFDRFVKAREEREYVDLNELMDRSLALVRYEQAGVDVIRDFSVELPPILAEPVRVIQVFSNIVLNAYQAMRGRGELRIGTRRDQDFIVIEIADNGPGISDELAEHIFEPFYTTKDPDQGTGLGLFIVRDILKDLGGEIEVRSGNDGTVFAIRIQTESSL